MIYILSMIIVPLVLLVGAHALAWIMDRRDDARFRKMVASLPRHACIGDLCGCKM